MRSIRIRNILGILAFAVILTGCGHSLSSENGKTIASDDNPIVNERGETHLDKLRENIAAFDKTIQVDDERQKIVQLSENGSIYYFAADGKRYIFPTEETYASWFGAYEPDRVMSLNEMQEIPLGGNVTVRPGSLITTPSDPNIYLVREGAIISPVDESVLKEIYGDDFESRDINLPNYYFTNYSYGEPIKVLKDYPLTIITLTIDQDKGLE